MRFPFEPNTPVPGLVPGTQVLNPLTDKDVDGRDKPGQGGM